MLHSPYRVQKRIMHCKVYLRSRILFRHKMLLSFIDVVLNFVVATTTTEATTTTPTTTTQGNVHECNMLCRLWQCVLKLKQVTVLICINVKDLIELF